MTTTTLSFKQRFFRLYRSTLKSNLGLFFLYTAVTLIMVPLMSGIEMFTRSGGTTVGGSPIAPMLMYGAANIHGDSTAMYLSFYVVLAPVLTVCAILRPLHNRRASDMYHALPISRRGLLGVWTAAGFTIMAVPLLLGYLLLPLAAAVVRYPLPIHPLLLAWDFLLLMMTMFSAMAIVTLCAVCTGATFDSVIFSVLIAGLPIAFWSVLENFIHVFADGVRYGDFIHVDAFLLVPGIAMSQHLFWFDSDLREGIWENVPYILLWLLIGCVLYALAFYFVRRRKGEMSGTLNRLPVLEHLLCGAVTLVCGFFFGLMLTNSLSLNVERDKWICQILFSAITGALAFAVVEAVLKRGLHGMKQWFIRTGAVFGIMAAVTGGVILYSETVVEDYLPDPSRIEKITVSRYNVLYSGLSEVREFPTAEEYQQWREGEGYRWHGTWLDVCLEENIRRISSIHRLIIEENNQRSWGYWRSDNSKANIGLDFNYHMKNGKSVSRQYCTYDTAAIDEILRLYGQEEMLCQAIPLFSPDYEERWGRLAVQDSLQLREKEYPTLGQDSAKFRRLIDTLRAEFIATGTETFCRETETPIAWIFYSYPDAKEMPSDDLCFISGIVPVYESFAKTVGLLEEYGYGELLEPDLSNVKKAVVTNSTRFLNCTAFNQKHFINYQESPESITEVLSTISSKLEEYDDELYIKELSPAELKKLLPQVRISMDKDQPWEEEKKLIICTDDRYVVRYLADEF